MTVICDFCSAPGVRWTFAARDFVLDAEKTGLTNDVGAPLDWASREGWAACDPCKLLIMATDREGLARRSASRYVKHHGGSFTETLPSVRLAQDGFWANRTRVEPVASTPFDKIDPTRS